MARSQFPKPTRLPHGVATAAQVSNPLYDLPMPDPTRLWWIYLDGTNLPGGRYIPTSVSGGTNSTEWWTGTWFNGDPDYIGTLNLNGTFGWISGTTGTTANQGVWIVPRGTLDPAAANRTLNLKAGKKAWLSMQFTLQQSGTDRRFAAGLRNTTETTGLGSDDDVAGIWVQSDDAGSTAQLGFNATNGSTANRVVSDSFTLNTGVPTVAGNVNTVGVYYDGEGKVEFWLNGAQYGGGTLPDVTADPGGLTVLPFGLTNTSTTAYTFFLRKFFCAAEWDI